MAWMTLCYLTLIFISNFQYSTSQRRVGNPVHLVSRTDSFLPAKSCTQDFTEKIASCEGKQLTAVPGYLSPDIQTLDLWNNTIPALLNDSFQNYVLLRVLDIGHNKISYIEVGALYPLKFLMQLNLGTNFGIVLPNSDMFAFSVKLVALILSKCDITYIPNDFFKSLPSLQYLYLDKNEISSLHIMICGNETIKEIMLWDNSIQAIIPESLTLLCKTDVLDLAYNWIHTVHADTIASLLVKRLQLRASQLSFDAFNSLFTGMARSVIQELSLLSVALRHIPIGFFSPLHDYAFEVLDLIFKRFIKRPDPLFHDVFSGLNLLNKLVVNDNEIDIIEPEYFNGMDSLRVLNLEYNRIVYLNPHNSSWTIDLREMYLSNNKVRSIEEFTFYGLDNLTILELNDNVNLGLITTSSVSGLSRLQEVKLSNTALIRMAMYAPLLKFFIFQGRIRQKMMNPIFPGKTFQNTPHLENIDLSDLYLDASRLWYRDISLFHNLYSLKFLNLSNNPIGNLYPGTFRQTTSLVDLYLVNCEISNISGYVFQGLESLQLLHLGSNQLHHISSDTFDILCQLRHLNLSNNLIFSFDDGVFLSLLNLTHLTLANNQLVNVNRSTFIPIMNSLSVIDLSGNPLFCNCQMKWLVEWLHGEIKIRHGESTICSSASVKSSQWKPLMEFHPSEVCHPNIALFCSIPAVVLTISVVIVMVHHYRWMLRYKWFLLKLAVLGYQEVQDAREHDDFEYDLNVVFTDDDKEWVRNHLKPSLEERLPNFNRNVYGDDELMLGMYILDAVHYAVENSFKTIVLLSRASVRDNWFLIKFRTAMDHVNDVEMETIVVIFLENMPDEELPYLVRLYLSDRRPFLMWVENERARRYFWDELIKDLTINLRRNNLIPPE